MESGPEAFPQVTRLLADWRQGSRDAGDRLAQAVYPELRQIASRFLHNERGHHTLEPNGLVDELCVRLFGSEPVAY